jgi:phosphoribosylamine--glycine ligase
MKILVVGSGGREHALLWKLHSDDPSAELFATRPNPGMARMAEAVDLSPEDVEGIASWADGNQVALTIVGPEVPLALGLADALRRRGLAVFGPTAAAARIESSKAFAKALMAKVRVPTAGFHTFTELSAAEAHIRESDGPLVVKASGLAAGKGAVVCGTTDEALAAAREMLEGKTFGAAGSEIVVEEFMEGEELSVFAVTDGRHPVLLLPSQDHKRIGEGDTGPNTGGMGAYAPVPFVTDEMMNEIRDTIFLPVLDGLERAQTPFRGLLYAGLMATEQGLRVIEFNCRFGDPETQVVLPLMQSSLLDLLLPVGRGGSIADATCSWRSGAALNTVLASAGYPGAYETGKPIDIPTEVSDAADVLVFHAGTRREGGRLVTDGGRVLSVVGLGEDLESARERSLDAADRIDFEGKTLRRDIGSRGLVSRARAPGG